MNALMLAESPRVHGRLIPVLHTFSGIQTVTVVHSVSAAMTWLRHHECDVVLLELSLKSGRALQLLTRLNQGHAPPQRLPTRIILTNNPSEIVDRHCKSLGAQAVFDIFIQIAELCTYLRRQHQTLH